MDIKLYLYKKQNQLIEEEIKQINIQIIVLLVLIVTTITSLLLTYNQKLDLQNKKTIFNKKQTYKISYINRLIILISTIIFLIINYKLYQISKKEGEDTLVYYLQITASVLTVIAALIVFYVVSTSSKDEISDIENPII